jgi:hypothetical protein
MKLAVAGNKEMVTGSSMEPVAKEDKREPTEGIRIIRLPDWYIKKIKNSRLQRRPSPLPLDFLDYSPKLREMVLALRAANKAHVDLEEDILRQLNEKGYAEVGVEVVDGVSNLCILPKPSH